MIWFLVIALFTLLLLLPVGTIGARASVALVAVLFGVLVWWFSSGAAFAVSLG